MKKARNWLAMPRDLLERTVTLDCDEDGEPYSTPANVSRVIEAGFGACLRWDAFTRQLTLTGMAPWCGYDWPDGQWRDEHATRLSIMLSTQRMTATSALVHELAHELGRRRAFNSLTEHVTALEWDGVARVDTMLERLCSAAPTEATRIASRILLLSAAARAVWPGCKVDTCTVLHGDQGHKKSTLLKVLAGKPSYVSESDIDFSSKAGYELLRGKWFVEVGEGFSTSKADVRAVKLFLSAQQDTYRAPYARTTEDHPRQSVAIITTNDSEILNDPTGARRFVPVTLGSEIDFEGVRAERDQLVAEAVARVLAGERYWLERAENEALADVRAGAQVVTPVEERIIDSYLRGDWLPKRDMLQTSDVCDLAFPLENVLVTGRHGAAVHAAMARLGWVRKSVKRGHLVRKGWRPATPEAVADLERMVAEAEAKAAARLARRKG